MTAGTTRRSSGNTLRRSNTRTAYLYITPAILGAGLFMIYPLTSALYHSFTTWDGLTPARWSGLANIRYMFFDDPTFWPSIRVTGYFVLLTVPSGMVFGLALAVLLNRPFAGIRVFRTVFYLPVVLPSIAVLTLWKYIYDPLYGLANEILTILHLPTSTWLQSPQMAMPAIVIVGIWGVGASMIIFLAALQNVPTEIYEAAKVDGAGPVRMFFSVTLPLITPLLLLQLVLGLVLAFQAFNQIQVMTNGGPGTSTYLFMFKIYNDAFGTYPNLGLATAESWFLFLIIMIVTGITLRTSKMWVFEANR